MTTRRPTAIVALALLSVAGCTAVEVRSEASATATPPSTDRADPTPTRPAPASGAPSSTVVARSSVVTATSTTTSTTSTTTTSTTTTTTTSTTLAPPPSTSDVPAPGSTGSLREIRPPSDIVPPPLPSGWVVEPIGSSVRGREIVSWSRRPENPRRTIVVIGAVHGNEPASPPLVRALVDVEVPPDLEIWLVPELNPDGVAAGTRWNANGVDLNRNFPWDWRAVDGGPGPLSEPESRAAVDLVERLQPDLVVWVHQPLGYVSSVAATDRRYEEAWSRGSGTPTRSGVTQHGGGETWTALGASIPSMLIEMDTWAATPEMIARHRLGFVELIASLP